MKDFLKNLSRWQVAFIAFAILAWLAQFVAIVFDLER
jgi:hypothetical protein